MIHQNSKTFWSFFLICFFVFLAILLISSCSFSQKNIPVENDSPLRLTELIQEDENDSSSTKTISKAERINNYIGFLNPTEVARIKSYNITGSNFHSNQSVFNVAYFLPANQARNTLDAERIVRKNIHGIYKKVLNESNLVLMDGSEIDLANRESFKIKGVNCLNSFSSDLCKLEVVVINSSLISNPEFIYRREMDGSYFVKLRVKLFLPNQEFDYKNFYPLVTKELPNWTFNLVDYETDQVVHILRSFQKYFF